MHHGVDYLCTGHAHFAGEHILCTSVAHSTAALAAAFTGDEITLRDEMDRLGYSQERIDACIAAMRLGLAG